MISINKNHRTQNAIINNYLGFLISTILPLFVAFLFVWPGYGEWKPGGLPNIAPPRVIKLILIICLLGQFFVDGFKSKLFIERIKNNYLLFIIIAIYHTIRLTSYILDSNGGARIISFFKEDLFSNLLLMFLAIYSIPDKNTAQKILKTLVVSSLIIGIIAVIESILKHNIFQDIITSSNAITDFALNDKSRDNQYRAQGPFNHPLILAQFMSSLLPIAWWWFRSSTGITKLIPFFSILLIIASTILTNTRSGLGLFFISLAGIFIIEIIIKIKKSSNPIASTITLTSLIGIVFVVLLSFYYLGNDLVQGRTREEGSSSLARVDMLAKGIPKMMREPLFGHGPTTAIEGVGFKSRFFGSFIDNIFLLIGLESGLIAALLFIFILLTPIAILLKNIDSRDKFPLQIAMSLGITIFSCFFVIHAASDLLIMHYLIVACTICIAEKQIIATSILN